MPSITCTSVRHPDASKWVFEIDDHIEMSSHLSRRPSSAVAHVNVFACSVRYVLIPNGLKIQVSNRTQKIADDILIGRVEVRVLGCVNIQAAENTDFDVLPFPRHHTGRGIKLVEFMEDVIETSCFHLLVDICTGVVDFVRIVCKTPFSSSRIGKRNKSHFGCRHRCRGQPNL